MRSGTTLIFLLASLLSYGGVWAQDAEIVDAAVAPLTTADPEIPLENLRVMVKPLTREELQVEADAWFELLKHKARQIAVVRLGVKQANQALTADDQQVAIQSLENVQKAKERVDQAARQTEQELAQAAGETTGTITPRESASTADRDSAEDESTDSTAQDSGDAEPGASGDPDPSSAQDSEASSDGSATGSPLDGPQDGVSQAEESANEMKEELLSDITVLQDERTALSDRLSIVLDSLESKGGEVEEYRQYSLAISGVELDTSDAQAAWSTIVGWFTSKEGGQRWGWNLLKFVLTLLIAYLLARFLASLVNWLLERKINLSRLAEHLIAGTVKNVFMLVGFAVALTALEIDVTPILAAIGATGLVIGLALQGTLSNFASGLMILVNRPFDVGDLVTAGGVTGKVRKMNLVSTMFHTFDNQAIYVPNNEIWNNVITNITANHTRRVDLEFGIGYDDDFEQAEQVIRQVVERHELVLQEPSPDIVTHELADSSVNIVCRPWVRTADWWQVKTDLTRAVKRCLDEEGISIPYPQRELHFSNDPTTTNSDSAMHR